MAVLRAQNRCASSNSSRRSALLAVPGRRRAVNYVAHFGIGAAWGAGHGLLASRLKSRGFASGAKVFAVLGAGDAVGNAALGVHDWPWRWSPRDAAVDLADKFLLAVATALAFDRLRTDP